MTGGSPAIWVLNDRFERVTSHLPPILPVVIEFPIWVGADLITTKPRACQEVCQAKRLPHRRNRILAPRMKFAVQLNEMVTRDMGVYLGCRYIGMTEHRLNRSQVGPAFQ